MLKKLGGIGLAFLGSTIFAFGLIKPIFDNVVGIDMYSHMIIGVIIVGFGVFVIKKD